MALGTLLGMTGLINDDRPSPPNPLPYPTIDYDQLLGQLPNQTQNINQGLLEQYMRQAPQFAQTQLDLERWQRPAYAQLNTDVSKAQLPQLIEMALAAQKQADPEGTALGKQIQNLASQELGYGREFAPGEENYMKQLMAGEALKYGRGTGLSDSFNLAKGLQGQRENNLQRRFANALQAYGGVGIGRQIGSMQPVVPQGTNTTGLLQQMSPGNILSGALQAKGQNLQATGMENNLRLSNFINDPNTYKETDMDKLYRLESSIQGIMSSVMPMLGGGGGGAGALASSTGASGMLAGARR